MTTSGGFNFSLETFGCKVNHYDSGLLQNRFISEGHKFQTDSQIHILNTCAVTDQATKEALKKVRQLKKRDPHSIVVVTGCAAQVDTDRFNQDGGADLVVANSHKGQLEEIVSDFLSGKNPTRVFKSNIFKKDDLESGGGTKLGQTRSFLKIQDGCNSFCTFCVIPFARGKSRSISIDELVDRVNVLYDQGIREVVLTGVHIGDYADTYFGADHTRGLEDLVEQLLIRTTMPRFRLSSLEPLELSDRLLEMYSHSSLCPHFHMSIQSANTKILKGMKRKYTAKDVEDSLFRINARVPEAFVGMDVIVGFPGESEDEFMDTYSRLAETPWTKIHVFPYSERPGTFANRLPEKWDRSLIMHRSRRMRELSSSRYTQVASRQIGEVKSAMVIGSLADSSLKGITRDYWNILIPDKNAQLFKGEEFSVEVVGLDQTQKSRMDQFLVGKVLQRSIS